MSEFNHIKSGFLKAKLDVVSRSRPGGFGPGARNSFFCEIVKSKGRSAFSIWPGSETNQVQVLDTDPSWRQLVLLVKEEANVIKMRQWDDKARKYVINTIKVPANKRKFLLGFDERDLFMAQLSPQTPVTTVRQAHDALRNPALPKKSKTKIQRQGEWFFRPVSKEELAEIEMYSDVIKHKARIGRDRRGKPHTAEEYVEVQHGLPVGNPTLASAPISFVMYVRGSVRHLDHASLNLRTWHRVYSNTEDRTVNARWID